jgi:hypothetical protein
MGCLTVLGLQMTIRTVDIVHFDTLRTTAVKKTAASDGGLRRSLRSSGTLGTRVELRFVALRLAEAVHAHGSRDCTWTVPLQHA